MIKSKKQSFVVIGIFTLVLMLFTTTYAFFNYTRTGSANTIRTGRIAFNSQQGTAINLTNVFPVDVTNGIPSNSNVGSVTINVTGDTTYGEGIEYLVSAVNVQNTIGSGANAKTLPISIDVSVSSNTNNDPATTLGTSDSDYFTNRGSTTNTSIYKVLASDVISNNEELLVGYIKSGATGVDGNIVIKAYIDKNEIAITDTYPAEKVRNVITTNYSSNDCETVLTGVQDASTYCATASDLQDAIDGEELTNAQIILLVNAGIVEEYTNGTTSEWVGDRTVFTTSEWNSIQSTGVSFQVKVEANEGTWVEEPISEGTIDSCPGCYFMYDDEWHGDYYHFGTNGTTLETITQNGVTYSTNYHDIVDVSHKNYFLGFTVSDGKIDKAYACGIKGETPNQGTPFCIQAIQGNSEQDDSTIVTNNINLITGESLWNDSDGSAGRCTITTDYIECSGSISPDINTSYSWVYVADYNEMMWCMARYDDYDGSKFYCGSVG